MRLLSKSGRRRSGLSAGVMPPNPQELIARPAFAQLLNRLVEHVDVVILETDVWLDGVQVQKRGQYVL